ncbi:MAG TPA: leucyl aminopeptidase [Pseudomonadales bacterium]|nr:leucyl aminopeptidase [Pseudomonadales bacterium]
MLTVSTHHVNPVICKTACLVLPVFSAKKTSTHATGELGKLVANLQKRGDIEGKPGNSLLLPHVDAIAADRLLLVGVGDGKALTRTQYLALLTSIADHLHKIRAKDAVLILDEISVQDRDAAWCAEIAGRQFSNSCYHFDTLKKDKKSTALQKLVWHSKDKKQQKTVEHALATGLAIAAGMSLARELGNLPGNVCTPSYLANQAQQLARGKKNLTVKVLDEKQMRALKMGSLLSVSAGSDEPAKLVIMDYKGGAKNAKPVVLVGKGITFDSGGISLKPGGGMEEMKFDMCGAASVIGVMQTIAELQIPLNVIGMLVCAENMPSGRATKPGDIVTSMSGKTIEVINTDAEGRLVLCDALTYAERFKPAAVIDIATLTGACVIALGNHASGLYSNRDELGEQLFNAGIQAEDKAWRMPLWEEYQQQLKSPYADVANVGGRNAGSVTAACFLARFTENYPWAHLDIAGTAWNSGGHKGATGRPVPLLVKFLLDYCHAN